jgi:phosphate-selective porin OprO/OprP
VEERLKVLEDQIREQQRLIKELRDEVEKARHPPAPVPPSVPTKAEDPTRIDATFDNGLKFKSAGGDLEAHVGGRLLTQGRFSNDRPDSSTSGPDSFFIRQARMETSGKFYKQFEFKVQVDFPTGTSTTSGTLQDTYVGWVPFPEFNLRVGQFKEPFSLQETMSTRFIDFIERANLTRLAPGQDIGIMVHGKPWGGTVSYELGLFNGQGRALLDTNDEKEVAGRLRVTPFRESESVFWKGLRVGVAATYGSEDARSFADLTTTETAIRFLDVDSDVRMDDQKSRVGAEALWRIGPVSLSGEYVKMLTDMREAQPVRTADISADAWYVAASWLSKPQETRVVPAKPFDLSAGTWGALEFAARYGQIEFEEEIFRAFFANDTDTRTSTNEVNTFTAGFNWWLRQNLRISLDYVHDWYEDRIQFDHRRRDEADAFLMRFQIDF